MKGDPMMLNQLCANLFTGAPIEVKPLTAEENRRSVVQLKKTIARNVDDVEAWTKAVEDARAAAPKPA
jgi:hypothetical protein